jgi:hypothetical protein
VCIIECGTGSNAYGEKFHNYAEGYGTIAVAAHFIRNITIYIKIVTTMT